MLLIPRVTAQQEKAEYIKNTKKRVNSQRRRLATRAQSGEKKENKKLKNWSFHTKTCLLSDQRRRVAHISSHRGGALPSVWNVSEGYTTMNSTFRTFCNWISFTTIRSLARKVYWPSHTSQAVQRSPSDGCVSWSLSCKLGCWSLSAERKETLSHRYPTELYGSCTWAKG